QTQYIYDTNKVNNIINLMNAFKRLKALKELKELQYQNQLETKQESYDSIVKLPQPEVNYMTDKTKTNNTNNDELIKGIAITTLGAGAVIIAAVTFPPIFASLGASLGQMAPVMTLLL
ncbi:hypothetical protein J8J04_03060, partial ['Fragaria x ananassa' phyllody phytoplasma]|nr:hypothetical protein ['Fragaria x ananassa' phyllody phytoplasma]